MSSFFRVSLSFCYLFFMTSIFCAHLWISLPSNQSSVFFLNIKQLVNDLFHIISNRWFSFFIFLFFVGVMINMIFYFLSVLNRQKLFSNFVPIFLFLSFSGVHIYFYENFDLAVGYLFLFLAIFLFFHFHYRLRSYDWAYILAMFFLLWSYFCLGVVVFWIFAIILLLMRLNGIHIMFRLSKLISIIVVFFVVYHTNISSFEFEGLAYYQYVESGFLTGAFYLLPNILFIYPAFCQKYRDYEKNRKIFTLLRLLIFFLLVSIIFFNVSRQLWFLSFLPVMILASFYFRIFERRNILQINIFFNYVAVILLVYFISYRSNNWEILEICSIACCIVILCFYNQIRLAFFKIFLVYVALNFFILQNRYLKYEIFQKDFKNFNFLLEDRQVYTNKNISLLNLLFWSSKKIIWLKDIEEKKLANNITVISELDEVPRSVHSDPLFYVWEKKSLFLETYNKKVYLWIGKRQNLLF